MKRLLASDIDGTLAVSDDVMLSEDKQAILKIKEAGFDFALVSGRSLYAIDKFLVKNNLPFDYILAASGNYVLDKNRDVIECNIIDFSLVNKVSDIIKKHRAVSYEFANGKVMAKDGLPENYKYFPDFVYDCNDHFYGSVEEIIAERKVVQIGGQFWSKEDQVAAYEELKLIEGIEAHMNLEYVDITAKGCDKTANIRKLKELENYDIVYVVGDGLNDLGMIEENYGFAIASGAKENFKVAKHVVNHINEAIKFILENE